MTPEQVYLNVIKGLKRMFSMYLTPRLRCFKLLSKLKFEAMPTGNKFLSAQWRQPIELRCTWEYWFLQNPVLLAIEVLNFPLNQILSDALMLDVKLPKECSAFKIIFDSCREFWKSPVLPADIFISISNS